MLSRFFHKPVNFFVGDLFQFMSSGFAEVLEQRAKESPHGFGSSFIGPSLYPIRNFILWQPTGPLGLVERQLKIIMDYDEDGARMHYEVFQKMIGASFVLAATGEPGREMRKKLFAQISLPRLYNQTVILVKEMLEKSKVGHSVNVEAEVVEAETVKAETEIVDPELEVMRARIKATNARIKVLNAETTNIKVDLVKMDVVGQIEELIKTLVAKEILGLSEVPPGCMEIFDEIEASGTKPIPIFFPSLFNFTDARNTKNKFEKYVTDLLQNTALQEAFSKKGIPLDANVIRSSLSIFLATSNLSSVLTLGLNAIFIENKNSMEKLCEEVSVVLKENKEMSRSIIMDEKTSPALHQAALECMRYTSAMPNVLRHTRKELTVPVLGSSLTIPPNTTVIVDLRHLLESEEYFKDGESFNPDRFNGNESLKTIAMLANGAGMRKCPARDLSLLIIKTVIFTLLSDPLINKKLKTESCGDVHTTAKLHQALSLAPMEMKVVEAKEAEIKNSVAVKSIHSDQLFKAKNDSSNLERVGVGVIHRAVLQ